MSAANKDSIGKVLYLAPIGLILVYMAILIVSDTPPSKMVTGLFFALAIFLSTLSSLLTGDIGIRGYGTFKKMDRPALYWLVFVFQTLIGVAALAFALWR